MAAFAAHRPSFISGAPSRSGTAILHLALVVCAAPCLTISKRTTLTADRLGRRRTFFGTYARAGTRPVAKPRDGVIVTTLRVAITCQGAVAAVRPVELRGTRKLAR